MYGAGKGLGGEEKVGTSILMMGYIYSGARYFGWRLGGSNGVVMKAVMFVWSHLRTTVVARHVLFALGDVFIEAHTRFARRMGAYFIPQSAAR